MQPLSPNQPTLRKFNLLLVTIAAVSLIASSCNKIPFPGGPVGNPTAIVCDIQDFNLFTGGAKTASSGFYDGYVQSVSTQNYWPIVLTGQNIQYNNHVQPVLASGSFDSLYSFYYDSQGRLSVVQATEAALFTDSLYLWKFGYKPGSILPDSIYYADVPAGGGIVYYLSELDLYDNNQRLIKRNFAVAGGTPNYDRFHYNVQGDLDTVYQYGAGFPGSKEEPILIAYAYDNEENLMLTNPTWTILSNMYSIHNPTAYTFQTYNPDGSVLFSESYSIGYLYGGALGNLPVTIFGSSPNPGPPPGTISYACTIGGGVTPVTGGQ